jgi:hypothetical protein
VAYDDHNEGAEVDRFWLYRIRTPTLFSFLFYTLSLSFGKVHVSPFVHEMMGWV